MQLSLPQIIILPPIRLVGLKREMSLADDQTVALFQDFMPRRKDIKHQINDFIHDMRVYPVGLHFADFTVHTKFMKWAAVEVDPKKACPAGFEKYDCSGGLYACFEHIGPAVEAPQVFGYIMTEWLPNSDFVLDDRPHLDRMGPGYDPNDPAGREEIWIPLKSN